MLEPGRIELTETEETALEKIAADLDGEIVSLTRRDPGETGPVLVTTTDGTFELEAD